MSIVQAVRSRLSVKISLTLALVLLVLTALAAIVITSSQTRQMEALTLEKARLAATIGARQFGDVFDSAIDSGLLTVNDVFDRSYVEIKGYAWGDKPKYHTRYDAFTDKAVLVFEDKFLDYEDFVFAVGVDENGYLPTHNSKFQQPLTGTVDKDLAGNRTKRIFADPVGLGAAKSLEPSLLKEYQRDTGETMWDVSSPIYVKGKHWGAFRIGVSMERIDARKRALLGTLAGLFAVFALVTIGVVFLVVQRAMRPVVALTKVAEDISLGDGLDAPIRSEAPDEIGALTRAIERLRISMRAAMVRLGGGQ
jgi:HAMP domain-containing protein